MKTKFNSGALIAALMTLVVGAAVCCAGPIIYAVDQGPFGIDGATVNGTLETNGTIGTLSASNFLTWNLLLTDGIGDSFTLNPGNSSVTITGTATTATASLLQFNYDTPPSTDAGDLGYFEILDSSNGWGWALAVPPGTAVQQVLSDTSASCCDAGLASLSPQPLTLGTVPETVVPEPSTYGLSLIGIGSVLMRKRLIPAFQ